MKFILVRPIGKLLSVAFASVLCAMLATQSVSAQVLSQTLNVNFGRSNDGSLFGGSGSYTGQGAYSDTGHNTWNNLLWSSSSAGPSNSTLTNLVYSNNTTATGVSVSFTGSGISSENYVGSTNQLLYGFILANSTSAGHAVNVNGLAANSSYDLYVYSQKSNTNGSTFTVGSQSYSLSGGTDTQSSGFVNNVNYYKFANVQANASGVLSIGWYSNVGGSMNQAPFNGFQLVQVQSTPEPSPWMLLTAAVVPIGFMMARRNLQKKVNA